MEVEVYADLLFLINAGMDWLCLSLVARLLHKRGSFIRLIPAAAVGGIYAVLALFWETGTVTALWIDMGVCLFMCAIAYLKREDHSLRRWLCATALYLLVSMLMGGIMTALFRLLNRIGAAQTLPTGGDGIGAWIFAIVAFVGGAFSLWGGRLFRRSVSVRTCTVTLKMADRRVDLPAVVDTGNLLRDPIGGRAVICVNQESIFPLLSPSLAAFVRAGEMDVSLLDKEDARRLRLIPAGTATGSQLLIGLRPDHVVLSSEKNRNEREVDAVIAISRTPLAAPNEIGEIAALVPAELF